MIPVEQLRDLLDRLPGQGPGAYLSGKARAMLPSDGVVLSGGEVAQIRHAINVAVTQVGTGSRCAPEVEALVTAALALLDSAGEET